MTMTVVPYDFIYFWFEYFRQISPSIPFKTEVYFINQCDENETENFLSQQT